MTALTSHSAAGHLAAGLLLKKRNTDAAAPAVRFRPSIDIEQVRTNWTLVEQLFKAFQSKDVDAILGAYSEDCQVDHPLIGRMSKDDFSRALLTFIRETPDYALEFQINHVGAKRVEAEWTMTHVFHLTGKTIRLSGTTTYLLSANRITRQIDQFDRRGWSRQAMGVTGLCLSFVPGWRSFIERELRQALGITAT
jgi:limonene-1,2-epoxide hydrolase